jgi:putative ABC transport system substrate-binding protein
MFEGCLLVRKSARKRRREESSVRDWETRFPTTFLSAPITGLRRRELIALLCGAALAPVLFPLSAHSQQRGKMPVIGFLGATTPKVWSAFVTAFLTRLDELGWADGRNIVIEYRWAGGREDSYAEFAAEFIRLKVGVIVTSGTGPTMAVKQATSEIPIVFAAAGDPVGTGLVASLARPGGNLTGLSNQQTDLAGNRLELLRDIVPGLRRVAVMGNVHTPNVMLEMKEVQEAASKLGLVVTPLEIKKAEDIVPGIEALTGRVDGLYVCTDPLITTHNIRINALAASGRLPTMYAFREYVRTGGLMSYGPNFPDLFRRAGDYVDKILRGAKPADLPVEQPVKFDLVINLATAKALGLTIPETFRWRASELIE